MPPEQATIDITLRIQMERARRDARQVQTFLAKISKEAAQAGKTGASGVDRLERAITDLQYSTVAGFDAMGSAVQGFDSGLKDTRDNTEQLMQSYVDYSALAQDLAQSAGQIGAMGEDAARRQDMAESFDYLAERANLSGDEIVGAMQKASKGTVDANTIMATSNMVLGAKFDTNAQDMARMMEFARLKSKEYGVSVSSAFQRMTLGAVKAEVEFLDEYGITIKLNDALDMYAEKLGKTKNELKATERSQALWNALLIQADEQLEDFPDGVDKSTDAYERWRLKWVEMEQMMGDFLHRSKIGPIMSVAAQAVQGLATTLTPLILMKGMAAKASTAHTASLVKETAAMTAQQQVATGLAGLGQVAAAKQAGVRGGLVGRVAGKIPISKAGLAAAAVPAAALGVAAGAGIAVLKTREKVLKNTQERTEEANKTQSEFIDKLREQATTEGDAVAVAQRYAEARRGVSAAIYKDGNALEDFMIAAARNQFDTEEQIDGKREEAEQIIRLASEAYPEYEAAIKALNAELPKGARATQMMSERAFDLQKALAKVGKGTDDAREKIRLYAAEFEKMSEGDGIGSTLFGMAAKLADPMIEQQTQKMRALGEGAAGIAQEAMKGVGLDAAALKAKTDALADSTGATSAEQREATDAVTTLAQGYALGIVDLDRYKQGMEQAKTGLLELTAAEKAAVQVALENSKSALSQADAMQALSGQAQTFGVDAEHMRKTQEALSVAFGDTTYQQIENRKELGLLAQGLALGTVTQERYLKAVEDVKDGTLDLSDAEREAISVANQRAQSLKLEETHMQALAEVQAGYQEQATQATEQYEAAQEQSARDHAARKEDIERQHQQRIAEIERQFEKSKHAAAIARDAVAMLAAQETRGEQLADAERTRQEGQSSEDRGYAAADQAATESYAQRMAEIDRMRQEELAKVRAEQAQELEMVRQQQADQVAQIAEAQAAETVVKEQAEWAQEANKREARNRSRTADNAAYLARIEEENALTVNMYDHNANRLASAEQTATAYAQTWVNAFNKIRTAFGGAKSPAGGQGAGRVAGGRNMARGGEGMVTGPASFHVGRGEREFVHFGGDQRQMVPDSQMNVRGGVNVDITSQIDQLAGPLADKIGEMMLPQIGQYLADEIQQGLA